MGDLKSLSFVSLTLKSVSNPRPPVSVDIQMSTLNPPRITKVLARAGCC